MSDKTLLIVEKGVKLNGDAYKKLEAAGFVIVRGNPSQFHQLPEPMPCIDAILYHAARKAIRETRWDEVRDMYGKNVVAGLDAMTRKDIPAPAPLKRVAP